MITLNHETKEQLLDLYRTKRIALEGNILKLIDTEGDEEFTNYITDAITRDREVRRKRLDITRQVQSQNVDLVKWKEENEKAQEELTALMEEQTAYNNTLVDKIAELEAERKSVERENNSTQKLLKKINEFLD